MVNIMHRVVIHCPAAQLFQAISTTEGLSQWWTEASGNSDVGDTIKFVFGPNKDHVVKMKVESLQSGKSIKWQCVAGPWTETGTFEFSIEDDPQGCVLLFTHYGWLQADDFYRHCYGKWGFFLISSLKPYLELGSGAPHPADPDM